MDTLIMWMFLIFWLVVIVGVIMGLIALISKFSNNTDAPTWCNTNSLDPNVFGFHCSNLSLAYRAADNSIRMRCIDDKGASYEFEGNFPDTNFSFHNEDTKTEYIQDYVSDSTGFKTSIGSPRGYERGTGIFKVGIRWKSSTNQPIGTTIRMNGDNKIKLEEFCKRAYGLSKDYLLKSEMIKTELEIQAQAAKLAAERKSQDDALQNVRDQCTKLLSDWGIASEGAFKTYRYRDDDGGYICTMLAADKEGRGGAVLNDGKDTWSGSWKNAQVSEVGDTLEVQIDDPEYRKQNLKEHRFVIKHMDREQRVEWIDRIRILSAQA